MKSLKKFYPDQIPPTGNASEVKAGPLLLIRTCNGRLCRLPVLVKVYHSSYGHYAVITKDKKYCSHSVFISLKNCQVTRNENKESEFTVMQDSYDGIGLTFQSNVPSDVAEWTSVFTSAPEQPVTPVLNRTRVMPTLEEKDEDV